MADNEKPQKPEKRFTSLAEHGIENVDVRIEFEDYVELVPMRTISFMRMAEINRSISDPTPPIHHIHPETKMPILDEKDPTYLRALYNAVAERYFRLMVEMLRTDIPGDTVDEKVTYLRGLDTAFINGLIGAINHLTKQGEAQLLARSATFQPDGTARTQNLSANGLVKTAVE